MTTSIISNNSVGVYAGTWAGVEDTTMVESDPTTPGSATGDYLYATSWTPSGMRIHSAVKFPTSGIGTDQEVSAASFNIRVEGGLGDFAIYRLNVPFVVGETSWNERSTGVAWTSPGGLNPTDVDTTPLVIGSVIADDWILLTSAELTAVVNGHVNGSIVNHGFLIAYYPDDAYDSYNIRFFRSPETSALGPSLVITHTLAPTGTTVTSVTQTSGGTEGSPAVMTVSLSGATSGSTNFAATLAGVTATGSGTDFTSDLASATYSNGVTFSGGNMVVPDAVSSWTVTISTSSDTLDEANETATLTIGGTAGTLTITDDDAAPTITGTASSTVTAGDPVVITYSPGLSGQTRTYTLALTDGTAVGGTDYDNTIVPGDFAVTGGSGTVTISGSTVTVSAGVTAFTLTIGTTA